MLDICILQVRKKRSNRRFILMSKFYKISMNVINFPVFFLCDIFWTAVRIRVIFCSYGRKLPQTY